MCFCREVSKQYLKSLLQLYNIKLCMQELWHMIETTNSPANKIRVNLVKRRKNDIVNIFFQQEEVAKSKSGFYSI